MTLTKSVSSASKTVTNAAARSGKAVVSSASRVASTTSKMVGRQSSKGVTSIKSAVTKVNPRRLNVQGIVLIVLGVLVLVGLGVGIYLATRKCDMYCSVVKSIRSDFNNFAKATNPSDKETYFINMFNKLKGYNTRNQNPTMIYSIFKDTNSSNNSININGLLNDTGVAHLISSKLGQNTSPKCFVESHVDLTEANAENFVNFSNFLNEQFEDINFVKLFLEALVLPMCKYNLSAQNRIIITGDFNPIFKLAKNKKTTQVTTTGMSGDDLYELITDIIEKITDEGKSLSLKKLIDEIVRETAKNGKPGMYLLTGPKCIRK